MHKQQGWPQAWEYSQAKLIQTLGRASQGVYWSWSQCIKSHHAQTSSGKGLPATSEPETTSEASYLGCGEKELDCCSVVQSPLSDESKCCISFGNQGLRVWRKSGEAQNPCCLKSSVKFPQSVMIWAAMSSAGVLSTVFLKSTVNAAIYQESLEHFMLLLLTSFMEMMISFSQQDLHLPTLPKVPKAGSMTMVLLCLIGQQTRLTWTHREYRQLDEFLGQTWPVEKRLCSSLLWWCRSSL